MLGRRRRRNGLSLGATTPVSQRRWRASLKPGRKKEEGGSIFNPVCQFLYPVKKRLTPFPPVLFSLRRFVRVFVCVSVLEVGQGEVRRKEKRQEIPPLPARSGLYLQECEFGLVVGRSVGVAEKDLFRGGGSGEGKSGRSKNFHLDR